MGAGVRQSLLESLPGIVTRFDRDMNIVVPCPRIACKLAMSDHTWSYTRVRDDSRLTITHFDLVH